MKTEIAPASPMPEPPKEYATFCPGCMSDKGDHAVCPHCGLAPEATRSPLVLPCWTELNRKFLVGRVLGKPGGFGITYLGWDTVLHSRVAIKEFLPSSAASRIPGTSGVHPHSLEDFRLFKEGLDAFLSEARTLVQFAHPNIMRVREFFNQNETAYLVMDYYEGQSLDALLRQKGGAVDQSVALQLMLPMLSGLQEVHHKGFLHRDIKPNNIYVTREGRPVLLDFGTARFVLGEKSTTLSVVLTRGYAPIEQYHAKGRQGPWTDVYACGATLYHMLTGKVPTDALSRLEDDDLVPPRALNPSVSVAVSDAVMQALSLKAEERPRDARALHRLLSQGLPSGSADMPFDDAGTGAIAAAFVPTGSGAEQERFCPQCNARNPIREPGSVWSGRCYRCGAALNLAANPATAPTAAASCTLQGTWIPASAGRPRTYRVPARYQPDSTVLAGGWRKLVYLVLAIVLGYLLKEHFGQNAPPVQSDAPIARAPTVEQAAPSMQRAMQQAGQTGVPTLGASQPSAPAVAPTSQASAGNDAATDKPRVVQPVSPPAAAVDVRPSAGGDGPADGPVDAIHRYLPGSGSFSRPQPPVEAFQACRGGSEGDSCGGDYSSAPGIPRGRCRPFGARLACIPLHAPPLRHRPGQAR